MNDEEVLAENEDLDKPIDPKELAALKKELGQRCKEANIELKEIEGIDEGLTILEVAMPAGREKRLVYLHDFNDIKSFLSIPFERYVFLSGYEAICSYEDTEIEAVIIPLGIYNPRLLYRQLFMNTKEDAEIREEDLRIALSSEEGEMAPEIVIGNPNDEIRALIRIASRRGQLSLRLRNIEASQQEQAISILERISNSLFFQIDLLSGISLALVRERRRPFLRRLSRRTRNVVDLQFPRNEYDEAPISLYWYAKSANNMPLLQFLAFYQVIEFYFPTYYQAEARRRIKAILKDPTFRNDREADLGKILGAIKVSRSGSFGDERSQLRAALTECVDADGLRAFIEANEERKTFLSSKTKGLTDHKLSVANPNLDLRNEVADRIYDIRCKIVHTKSDSGDTEIELLLPFSKQAGQLNHDIELLQFLAQQVLISASTPLLL